MMTPLTSDPPFPLSRAGGEPPSADYFTSIIFFVMRVEPETSI